MKKHLATLSSLLVLTALLVLPYFVFAQTTSTDSTIKGRLETIGKIGGYKVDGGSDLLSTTGLIINALLGLLGVIFIILLIVAGFKWMTAAGNEQKVDSAITTIKRAIIGLVITLSSWAIWSFILNSFINK